MDGLDLGPVLFERLVLPPRPFFYYRGDELFACRWGEWKVHFQTQPGYTQAGLERHDPPILFHLGRDSSEKRDVAAAHPEVVAQLRGLVDVHRGGVMAMPSNLR